METKPINKLVEREATMDSPRTEEELKKNSCSRFLRLVFPESG